MNRVFLLEAIKTRQEADTKDLIMQVKPQKGDTKDVFRAPEIWTGDLPDVKSQTDKAPYVLNKCLQGEFFQHPGDEPKCMAYIRTIYCVYNPDRREGHLMLLNLMDRIRISLQKNPILPGGYEVDLDENGILDGTYESEKTHPFHMGEMITAWQMPPVEREVQPWLL